jgi:putative zinc-dependent peptidase DUF5700
MRKIVQVPERSKRTTTPLIPLLAALALMTALFGCGDGDKSAADADGRHSGVSDTAIDEATTTTEHEGYTVHSLAYDAWRNTAMRLLDGKNVRTDEYERIYALPAYTMSYGDKFNQDLNPTYLRLIMEYVFNPARTDEDVPPRRKMLYTANGDYLADRLEAASNLAQDLEARDTVGRAMTRAYPYIEEHRRPDMLNVRLFAASPQITWYPPNTMVLDVGLALAAGPEQLEDIIAATLVRSLAPPTSPLPHEAESGREALRSTFRKMHHEGIVGLIEKYQTLKLDVNHPTFRSPDANRGRAVLLGAETLVRMNRMLETLLDPDAGLLESTGGSVDDLLRINKRYAPTGYAMNRLIIDRLGEERFREAIQAGPSAWIEAYQEAALLSGAMGELSQLQPFDEVVCERILALLND